MSTPAAHPSTAASQRSRASAWRQRYLVGLTVLSAYSTGIGWRAQQVSYPLYRAVGTAEFAAYHQQYNSAIPLVVIAPGFLTFLAAMAFPLTRPRGVSRTAAAAVALCGMVSLLSTVLWAIPRHDDLDRIGQDAATIDSLLRSNLLRTLALTAATIILGWSLARPRAD